MTSYTHTHFTSLPSPLLLLIMKLLGVCYLVTNFLSLSLSVSIHKPIFISIHQMIHETISHRFKHVVVHYSFIPNFLPHFITICHKIVINIYAFSFWSNPMPLANIYILKYCQKGTKRDVTSIPCDYSSTLILSQCFIISLFLILSSSFS